MLRKIKHILKLYKWLLSFAIACSSVVGYSLFGLIVISNVFIILTGVFFQSAAASALNQYYERQSDKLMHRTKNRPIPSGKLSEKEAIIAIIISLIIGTTLLAYLSVIAAILGIFNLLLYVYVYTPLKYKSHLAIIPGGMVGAIPPLMGWFSGGDDTLSAPIVFYAVFMFFWQIPHFMLLNLKHIDDYNKAGITTLGNSVSDRNFGRIFLLWCCGTIGISLMFPLVGIVTGAIGTFFLLLVNVITIVALSLFVFKTHFKKHITQANIIVHSYLLINIVLIAFN